MEEYFDLPSFIEGEICPGDITMTISMKFGISGLREVRFFQRKCLVLFEKNNVTNLYEDEFKSHPYYCNHVKGYYMFLIRHIDYEHISIFDTFLNYISLPEKNISMDLRSFKISPFLGLIPQDIPFSKLRENYKRIPSDEVRDTIRNIIYHKWNLSFLILKDILLKIHPPLLKKSLVPIDLEDRNLVSYNNGENSIIENLRRCMNFQLKQKIY